MRRRTRTRTRRRSKIRTRRRSRIRSRRRRRRRRRRTRRTRTRTRTRSRIRRRSRRRRKKRRKRKREGNEVTSARELFFPLNPSLCKGRALLLCFSLSCLVATNTPLVTGLRPSPAAAVAPLSLEYVL